MATAKDIIAIRQPMVDLVESIYVRMGQLPYNQSHEAPPLDEATRDHCFFVLNVVYNHNEAREIGLHGLLLQQVMGILNYHGGWENTMDLHLMAEISKDIIKVLDDDLEEHRRKREAKLAEMRARVAARQAEKEAS